MRIVIVGGSSLIGRKLASALRCLNHEVISISEEANFLTRNRGAFSEILAGAQVVVDVTRPPSFQGEANIMLPTLSEQNLISAAEDAGVRHHLALSEVGAERFPESEYFSVTFAHERLFRDSAIPSTILRSTQIFELIDRIAWTTLFGESVRLPDALFQPVASDDVVEVLVELAIGPPSHGTIEVAGPVRFRLHDGVEKALRANGDIREVVRDPQARYFGAQLNALSLLPSSAARLGTKRFEAWLIETALARHLGPPPFAMAPRL